MQDAAVGRKWAGCKRFLGTIFFPLYVKLQLFHRRKIKNWKLSIMCESEITSKIGGKYSNIKQARTILIFWVGLYQYPNKLNTEWPKSLRTLEICLKSMWIFAPSSFTRQTVSWKKQVVYSTNLLCNLDYFSWLRHYDASCVLPFVLWAGN